MALTKNRELDHYIDQELRTYAVKAAAHIYKGAMVGIDVASGYVRALVAGDPFVGFATNEADNTSGANAAITVRVYTMGDFGLTLTGAAITDLGRPVFASADDTLTFVGIGNSYVGIVQDVPAADAIILRTDTAKRRVKTLSYQVEDLAAGADIAARAIHNFDQEGFITAARVVNQGTAAAGIDASNTCVVALAIDAGAVASKTYNNAVVFPGTNAVDSLGALTNTHAAKGNVLTLAVTNGATANPGTFLVEVDYV